MLNVDLSNIWSQVSLPELLGDRRYYEYGDNKTEQAAKRYWEDVKKQSE